MNKKNPDNRSEPCCTWREDSDCNNCILNEQLNCKWNRKLLMRFLYDMLPPFIIITAGTILGAIQLGNWWWFGIIIGYYIVFFIVETRILCAHCPYYSEEGKILHCLANQGFFKYAKYHPGPMNQFEKGLFYFGFIMFGGVPLINQISNIVIVALNRSSFTDRYFISLIILLALLVVSCFIAFYILFSKICVKCVNFSCPFNTVPKKQVDEYLHRNPTMKKAWVEKGYKLKTK